MPQMAGHLGNERLVQLRPVGQSHVSQVLVGPYGGLLAAFAQVTVGFVQLRRRDEAQSRVPSSPPIGGSPSDDQEHDDAEVHPDECRACSRFDWWMPESQS